MFGRHTGLQALDSSKIRVGLCVSLWVSDRGLKEIRFLLHGGKLSGLGGVEGSGLEVSGHVAKAGVLGLE